MRVAEEIYPIAIPMGIGKKISIFIVGLGGTGSYLLEDLARYISLETAKGLIFGGAPSILLIDGETVNLGPGFSVRWAVNPSNPEQSLYHLGFSRRTEICPIQINSAFTITLISEIFQPD